MFNSLDSQPTARTDTFRSDRPISGFAPLPLRLFLGITFMYAAVQKLNDPGFFKAGSPTFVGAQLQAFSRGSPIQGALHQLMEHAVAVGLLTIATEGAVGLLIMLGLLTRPAALVGLTLSFVFFLSASWQTYPYFFGSDIVFVVCWLTLILTGPGVYALDLLLEEPLRQAWQSRMPQRTHTLAFTLLTGMQADANRHAHPRQVVQPMDTPTLPSSARRLFTRGEALVASAVAIGLIALGLHPRGSRSAQTSTQLSGGSASVPATGNASPTAGTGSGAATAPGIPAGAKKVGNISQLPVNSAGTVTDPKTGDPAIIVRTSASTTYAYDAVCTHAGCTVQYDPQQKYLVCPCHGGIFDPAHGAQVVGGPPPSPLTPIQMKIDAQGNIYIV